MQAWQRLLALVLMSCPANAAEQRPSRDAIDILDARNIATEKSGIPVLMRDGTQLFATIIMPKVNDQERLPTILIQTPYSIDTELKLGTTILPRLVRAGYAIVVVNIRGTQWSEGKYRWMIGAADDGEDSIEWIIKQPWSNGKVGTFGCSTSGEVQLALAKRNPPALKATVPMAAATGYGRIPGFVDQGIFYTGGVPSYNWAQWYRSYGHYYHPKLPSGISQEERERLMSSYSASATISKEMDWAKHLPSAEVLLAAGTPDSEFNRLITMKPNDPRWAEYDFFNEGDSTRVPMLHIDSWYDAIEIFPTAKGFEYLSKNSPDQYLIIGGGAHCSMGSETEETMVGERPIGDARFDYAGQVERWFDHWLKNDGKGELGLPRVQYYPLASSRWESAPAWPPRSTVRRLYLDSRGNANGLAGSGLLSSAAGSGPPDKFIADPLNPVPTLGGGCCDRNVARDQTAIEEREDVLVYTTKPLAETLKIAGYINATFYFSTSVPDADIAIKLVDVYPDGRAFNITDTIQRLRYRDGIDREAPLKPGRVYRIDIKQLVAASHFAPGHRLRIEIAGSNFPQYERNMQRGDANHEQREPLVARNVIYHEPGRASFIELPVVR
ncbi:acylase [Sphingosinicella microcystinivorans]|uniref:Acylase n=2 Tax=Sphingosinicella microcystinivorans TaxID=335406 RepID=A0AAD1D6F7_SPHMI|nr:acylase [Sphingosinicella microcystinivorans]